jgi:hypothetical protein
VRLRFNHSGHGIGCDLSDKTNVTNVKHAGHATVGPEVATSGARRVRVDRDLVLSFLPVLGDDLRQEVWGGGKFMKVHKGFALAAVMATMTFSTTTLAVSDPPSRVARLQYISGQVSVQPSGVDDWIDASVNRPLTTADRLWADKNSRGELQLGGALMRISAETSMTLTDVSDQTVQVELDQGALNMRIRHLYDGEIYEVDTPNVAFTITKSGEYRFDVDPDGDTTFVTVWKGKGEATGDDRAVTIRRGEQAKFTNGNSLEHQILDEPDRDGFDDWCRVRDERLESSESARYVSPDVIGAQDLDNYGTWRVAPTYGAVWYPAVAPGWTPYHDGHWVWVDPWGWTWVDDAPWGFAPAHYGRWVYYGGAWGWVPGPVAVRPVYAPAVVAWVSGSNFGVTITSGEPVGWFPLGYGEPYIPPYGVSQAYFQNVNTSNTQITNITTVTNNYYSNTNVTNGNVTKITYVNQRVPGAVTAVPRDAMVNSQPVARYSIQIPPGQLQHATIAVAPRVAPERESVIGARMDRDRPRGVPPARVQPRSVVSHVAPPPRPVRFEEKREALASHPGRPLDRDAEEKIRAKLGRQPANPPAIGSVQSAGPQHENEGVRRGPEDRYAGPPQPSSDIRVNGRVTSPAPDSVQQNTAPGRENENDRPGPAANGHYVPRPPQHGQQAEQTRQGHQGNGVPREVETRGGQNRSNRELEPAVAGPGQGRVIEQPQNLPTLQPPQDRENANGRGQNSAPATGPPSQDRPADEAPRAQERNVPRPPERNMNLSSAPAEASPSQPRGNSAGDQGRKSGNGNYSAQPRSNRQAEQPSSNAVPAQTRQSQREAPAPSVRQTSYDNRPAPSQPEFRPAAPQRQEIPAAHANSSSGRAAAPAQESKAASSHSEDKGKSKDDKH